MITGRLKYMIILIPLLLLCSVNITYSQSLAETESKYKTVTTLLENEQRKLDSLNTLLNDRAAAINREKKKSNPVKEQITDLMSNSILLSNQINDLQKKIVILEAKREDLKVVLRNAYGRIIDSLNTAKVSGKKSSDTELQILTYSEKKLSIVQKFPDLSFNPGILISVDPSSIKNPDERKIFRDYLNKALSEIEEKISYVDKQSAEIKQVLSLQKKAEKFIEESEYTESYGFSRKNGSTEQATRGDVNYSEDYITNAQNAKSMLNQFRAIEQGEHKPRQVLSTNLSNLSLRDYQQLLKELKENLITFRTILHHKTKSFE